MLAAIMMYKLKVGKQLQYQRSCDHKASNCYVSQSAVKQIFHHNQTRQNIVQLLTMFSKFSELCCIGKIPLRTACSWLVTVVDICYPVSITIFSGNIHTYLLILEGASSTQVIIVIFFRKHAYISANFRGCFQYTSNNSNLYLGWKQYVQHSVFSKDATKAHGKLYSSHYVV